MGRARTKAIASTNAWHKLLPTTRRLFGILRLHKFEESPERMQVAQNVPQVLQSELHAPTDWRRPEVRMDRRDLRSQPEGHASLSKSCGGLCQACRDGLMVSVQVCMVIFGCGRSSRSSFWWVTYECSPKLRSLARLLRQSSLRPCEERIRLYRTNWFGFSRFLLTRGQRARSWTASV